MTNIDPQYDAFSDIGLLSRRFRMLDAPVPGQPFVLWTHVTERRQWIASRRRHVERNLAMKAAGQYEGTFLVIDEEKWAGGSGPPCRAVSTCTSTTRAAFIELDLSRTPGVGVRSAVCSRCPSRSTPFPWENRGADRSRGPAARLLARFSRS